MPRPLRGQQPFNRARALELAALYHGDWDRLPTMDQLRVIEAIKLDPQGILSASAKARNAEKLAERHAK